jgi:hypothetical protein
MAVAVTVLIWVVGRNPGGPAEAAVLLPALVIGMSQGRSFATGWGAITECLGYLKQLFEFLDHSFEKSGAADELTSGDASTVASSAVPQGV